MNKKIIGLKILFQTQKLIESYEIINIPEDSTVRDSAAIAKSLTLKKEAKDFLAEYAEQKKQWESLDTKKDSLERKYKKMIEKIQGYEHLIKNELGDFRNTTSSRMP